MLEAVDDAGCEFVATGLAAVEIMSSETEGSCGILLESIIFEKCMSRRK